MDQENNLKYNYVICGSDGYYDIGYRDIMNLDYVRYYHRYDSGVSTLLMKKLIRINFSQKVNRIIKTPLAKIVYPHIYKPIFENINKPICFIFFGNVEYVYQTSFIQFIRNTYPDARIVLYMQDLIHRNANLDFYSCRNSFDLIISYDKGEANKYNMYFHPTPMSAVNVEMDESIKESDIYFCGYAKSRFPIIHDLYIKFTQLGLKCDFHLMKFPSSEPRIEGICYENQDFTYEQNIQHVLKSRCILEIMQDGADGFTPRVWESIIYDKHLITNNCRLKDSEYFNPNYMHDINNIDISSFINNKVLYCEYEKERLSPIHLLEYIDELLTKL